MNLCEPLIPKNADGILRVIIPARVSTTSQDIVSNDSQHAETERQLRDVYAGRMQIHRFGDQASGWQPNRPGMDDATQLIESGEWDLVIVGELRETYRNPRFVWAFVQNCVDNDTRFISIADGIDTADEEWENRMHVASFLAGMARPEARRRVRRKATHAFKNGGMVGKIRYGYLKLTKEQADSGGCGPKGLRIAKDVTATPYLHQMKNMVMEGESYEFVADWLQGEGVDPGPYATNGKWTGRLVRDLLRDPLLSGKRQFRVQINKLKYKTGKHDRRRNPKPPEMQEYPELAHFRPEEHRALLNVMDARKAIAKQSHPAGRESAMYKVPRARTFWPGQSIRCGICGGRFYRFGKVLKCQNARGQGPHGCWNRVQIRTDEVYAKVLPLVVQFLDRHPRARQVVAQAAWGEYDRVNRRQNRSATSLDAQIAELEVEANRLARAIAKGICLESIESEAAAIREKLVSLRAERAKLSTHAGVVGTYQSIDDLAVNLVEALQWLVVRSRDFADVLRKLIPTFTVRPVQALDSSQIRPRANLVLSARTWSNNGQEVPEVSVTVDLFDPPVHIKYLEECVEAKQKEVRVSLTKIGERVGVNHMTVKRALDYKKLMDAQGLSAPYRDLTECPAIAARWGKRVRGDPDGSEVSDG